MVSKKLVRQKLSVKRLATNSIFRLTLLGLSLCVLLPLIIILKNVVLMGVSQIDLALLTELPGSPEGERGGILNGIIGTLLLLLIASCIAIPLCLGVTLFLYDRKEGEWFDLTQTAIDIVQGIPSIVIGIVIYYWIVKPMGQFSLISGGLALAIMMLPIMIRSIEEALKKSPEELKDVALSLGVPYYRCIRSIILPSVIRSICSGICMSIARVSGETAPLLFTILGSSFISFNLFKESNSLSLIIYNYALSPYENWQNLAWGASIVLILFILLLNITANLLSKNE